MLTKKRIRLAALFGICILGLAMIFFISQPKQTEREVIRGHFDKILSLSGELTPEEKQICFDIFSALDKYELPPDKDVSDYAPPEELERLQAHLEELLRQNPDLQLPSHGHAHGSGHEHVYQKQTQKQEELANINAAIEDVKASDAAEGAKAALLNSLEHRRGALMDDGSRAREMERVAEKIMETEPDVVGLKWDAHGYKRI